MHRIDLPLSNRRGGGPKLPARTTPAKVRHARRALRLWQGWLAPLLGALLLGGSCGVALFGCSQSNWWALGALLLAWPGLWLLGSEPH